jgi:hypothetical protein
MSMPGGAGLTDWVVQEFAVTPAGKPDAARVTGPVSPPISIAVTVLFPLPPWTIVRLAGEAESVKLWGTLTVTAMVVDAVTRGQITAGHSGDVPVTVTVNGPPSGAVLLAVSVSVLVLVAGLGTKAAVTPVGKPVAVRFGAPANPPTSAIVMLSPALLPGYTVSAGVDAVSVKPGAGLTVSAMGADPVSDPETPLIVTVAAPVVAVLLAVSVITLAPVAGLVPKLAFTPLGSPLAVSVTPPVIPPNSVTTMVSELLNPATRVSDELTGVILKFGADAPYHFGSVISPAGLFCGEYPVSLAPGADTLQSHQKTPFIHAVSRLKTSKNAS